MQLVCLIVIERENPKNDHFIGALFNHRSKVKQLHVTLTDIEKNVLLF